jgi:hypothetical protein
MELLAGMHLKRQSGADVAYGNIQRKNNTLKVIIPPGTVTETTRQQPNSVVTSELTFKFSTANLAASIQAEVLLLQLLAFGLANALHRWRLTSRNDGAITACHTT